MARSCKICGKVFQYPSQVTAHMRTHTDGTLFKCQVCGEGFSHKFGLFNHMGKHSNQEQVSYRCDVCGKQLISKQGLEAHQYLHSNERPYKCQYCNRTFVQIKSRKTHERKCKEDPGSSTAIKKRLNKPRISKKEQSCQCDTCSKWFTTKPSLKVHMRIHTGERPYKCHYCDESFIQVTSRKYHERTRHNAEMLSADVKKPAEASMSDKQPVVKMCNVKPATHSHRCDICAKLFKTKQGRKVHMRLHTGERPYICRYCDKTFAQSATHKYHEPKCENLFFSQSKEQLVYSTESQDSNVSVISSTQTVQYSQQQLECTVRLDHLKHHDQNGSALNQKEHECQEVLNTANQDDEGIPENNQVDPASQAVDARYKAIVDRICDICGQMFQYPSQVVVHRRIHDVTGTIQCHCHTKTHEEHSVAHGSNTKDNLRSRKTSAHLCYRRLTEIDQNETRGNRFQENHCDENNNTNEQQNIYKCPICSSIFSTISSFKMHVVSHSEETDTFAVRQESFPFTTMPKVVCQESTAISVFKDPIIKEPIQQETTMKNTVNQESPSKNVQKVEHTNPARFECHLCPRTFQWKRNLGMHLKAHSNNHSCSICGKSFITGRELKLHLPIHRNGLYQCSICDQRFLRKAFLSRHMRSHYKPGHAPVSQNRTNSLKQVVAEDGSANDDNDSNERSTDEMREMQLLYGRGGTNQEEVSHDFKPKVAKVTPTMDNEERDTVYLTKENVAEIKLEEFTQATQEHGMAATDKKGNSNVLKNDDVEAQLEKPTVCTDNEEQADHTVMEKRYMCPVCGVKFQTAADARSHMNRHDNNPTSPAGPSDHRCSLCGSVFGSLHQLKCHAQIHSIFGRPYKCLECARVFVWKKNLIEHIWTHSGEKPLVCTVCQQRFRHASGLSVHRQKHTRTLAVAAKTDLSANDTSNGSSCERGVECDTVSPNSSNMERHQTELHDIERPYKCPKCEKTFLKKIYLKNHFRIHTDVKAFGCNICHEHFKQRAGLWWHKRKHQHQ